MIDNNSKSPALSEAASRFLAKVSSEDKGASQQEVSRFVRWFGQERRFSGLTAPEVANYAERLSSSDTDYARKLELIRAFLVYAKKEGWSSTSLATHLKSKKSKAGVPSSGRRGLPESIPLTREGYDAIVAELAGLKQRSRELIVEIRKAAADKDFRENAPLAAAREERGHVEGRIKEMEETLKAATIVGGEKKRAHKAGIGDHVVLYDPSCGEELNYMLVSPKEVDPARGKISSVSPIGRAIFGKGEGETVEVTVPAGKLCYQIKRIER